jgi:hypothetical protein
MDWEATVAKWKAKTHGMIGDGPLETGGRPAEPGDPVPDDPAEDPPEEIPPPPPLPDPMPDRA